MDGMLDDIVELMFIFLSVVMVLCLQNNNKNVPALGLCVLKDFIEKCQDGFMLPSEHLGKQVYKLIYIHTSIHIYMYTAHRQREEERERQK